MNRGERLSNDGATPLEEGDSSLSVDGLDDESIASIDLPTASTPKPTRKRKKESFEEGMLDLLRQKPEEEDPYKSFLFSLLPDIKQK